VTPAVGKADHARHDVLGELDGDGYLKIVDRKKELIITAGGKNISPANIEKGLKEIEPIGQAAVIGDQRPYLVGILVLDPDTAPTWAKRWRYATGR